MKRRLPLLVVLAVAAALGWSIPAAAHAVLVSSSPEPGATIASPATVSLTFDDALLEIGAHVFVLDAQGGEHASGDAYFPSPETIRVDVQPLDAGVYNAEWRVVADDGHPIEGTIPFTVVASAASPQTSLSGQAATDSPQASPSGQDSDGLSGATEAAPDGQFYLTFAVVLAAVAALAIAVFLLRPKGGGTRLRRRRQG
jgi:hypothetical protein